MGEEFLAQLTGHPKALTLVSGIMLLFGIVPGMPFIPFFALSALLFGLGRVSQKQKDILTEGQEGEKSVPQELETPEEVQQLLPLDSLELEVGYGLIPLVDEDQNGNLLARIRSIRRQFALDMGVIIPSLHLRDNLQLKPGQYAVLIKGNEVASAEILIDHFLAMDPGDVKHRVQGVDTREPAFNLPALWIPEQSKEEAMLAGYTVVDPATVISTHLTEVFRRNLHEFLGRQEVQALLDNLHKRAPKAVEELVPGVMSLGILQKVLQNLVRESVSVRDMLTIVETLADYGLATKDPDQLTEYVRSRMGRSIVKPFLTSDATLPIFTLSPAVEGLVQEAIRHTDHGSYLAMEPGTAQSIISSINSNMERAAVSEGQPVLLVSPVTRPHLAQLLNRFLPTLPVISQAEIPSEIRLHSLATIGMSHAG